MLQGTPKDKNHHITGYIKRQKTMSQGVPKTKTQVTEENTMLQGVPIDKNTMLQSTFKH